MSQSFDAFDSFVQNRDKTPLPDGDRSPHEIHDLLDAMDRVFTHESPPSDASSESREPAVETHPLAELITRLCRMQEELPESPHRDTLKRFLDNLESAVWRLVEQTERLSMAAGTCIEVELDHDELHEFMLNHDLSLWHGQRT